MLVGAGVLAVSAVLRALSLGWFRFGPRFLVVTVTAGLKKDIGWWEEGGRREGGREGEEGGREEGGREGGGREEGGREGGGRVLGQ